MHIFQAETCISVDYAHQHISISKTVPGTAGGPPTMVSTEIDIEKKDSLMEELKAFIRCSASKERPLVSGAEGLKALKIAAMVQEAIKLSMAEFTPKNGPPGR
jgi:predicted dehydrogenase